MSDDQCPTTHGHLRCMHKRTTPHVNCEVEDTSRCHIAIGPYRDLPRTVAYVRGALDIGRGTDLDVIGARLGIRRSANEDDCAYRARVIGALP